MADYDEEDSHFTEVADYYSAFESDRLNPEFPISDSTRAKLAAFLTGESDDEDLWMDVTESLSEDFEVANKCSLADDAFYEGFLNDIDNDLRQQAAAVVDDPNLKYTLTPVNASGIFKGLLGI